MKNIKRKEKQYRVCIGFNEAGESWSAIRTNRDGIPLALYESSNQLTLEENLHAFSEWMIEVEQSVIVILNQEKYYRLLKAVEDTNVRTQMDNRLMRANQWNVTSDFSYRYHYKKNLSLDMMMLLCELDQVKHGRTSTKEAFHLLSLTNVMIEDKKLNECLSKRDKRGHLKTILERWSSDKLFNEVMMRCPRFELVNEDSHVNLIEGDKLVATSSSGLSDLLVEALLEKMDV